MSIRKIVKKMRQVGKELFHDQHASKCENDREEYFHELANWAKLGHKLASDESQACARVKQRVHSLREEHPWLDYERDPLAFSQVVEQLASPQYAQEDVEEMHLVDGYVYVGTNGVSVGLSMSHEISGVSTGNKYHNKCESFAKFVNAYQKSVVHAHADVMDNDNCDIHDYAPDMTFRDCREAEVEMLEHLPTYPTVVIDDAGRLISSTDSQCTRCANVSSYGLPCTFCASERFGHHPTCRQHFGSIFHPGCSVHKVKAATTDMDQLSQPELDYRWACAAQAGQVHVVDARGNLVSDAAQKQIARERYIAGPRVSDPVAPKP